jgi:alpha-1,3-glucan synthase
MILLFIIVWTLALFIFRILSREPTWTLPLFGLSLGAPRWAKTRWEVSNIGYYLLLAGGLTSGARYISGSSLAFLPRLKTSV